MTNPGFIVIFTGGNGVGKDTIAPRVAELLHQENSATQYHYGPGINGATKALQTAILTEGSRPSSTLAMALAYYAIHAEAAHHLALLRDSGINIVLNRGPETAWLYNVLIPGLDQKHPWLRQKHDSIMQTLQPNLTVLLDAPAQVALERANQQATTDQFQQEAIDKHEARRQAYLKLAEQETSWVIVDATGTIEQVTTLAHQAVKTNIKE